MTVNRINCNQITTKYVFPSLSAHDWCCSMLTEPGLPGSYHRFSLRAASLHYSWRGFGNLLGISAFLMLKSALMWSLGFGV